VRTPAMPLPTITSFIFFIANAPIGKLNQAALTAA
jgi:hypothetical protein